MKKIKKTSPTAQDLLKARMFASSALEDFKKSVNLSINSTEPFIEATESLVPIFEAILSGQIVPDANQLQLLRDSVSDFRKGAAVMRQAIDLLKLENMFHQK